MTGRLDPGPVDGVLSFWRVEDSAHAHTERVLPSGRAQVVVDLDTGRGVLVGPRTIAAEATPPTSSAGFAMDGTGLFRIVGPDAAELVDTTIDLDDLGGQAVARMACERLGPSELHRLARQLVGRFDVDPAIAAVEDELRRGTGAAEAVTRVGVDRRRFVPGFRTVVGVGPKHYERLNRFQRAIHLLRTRRDLDLANVAVLGGFADQPHLNREIRALAMATPGEVRSCPGPLNHLRYPSSA